MRSAEDIEPDRLADLLMAGTGEILCVEASVRLLVRHGFWLRHRGFLRHVELFGDPVEAAGVHWKDVMAAFDEDGLGLRVNADFTDQEAANILRIAASLHTFYQLSLRDVMERIGRDGIKHVAEAIMYADGYTGSVAQPMP